jgi:hypothetical protein
MFSLDATPPRAGARGSYTDITPVDILFIVHLFKIRFHFITHLQIVLGEDVFYFF